MQLSPETTVFMLLEEYPFLEPFLDRFAATAGVYGSREARRKIGRMFTLRQLALVAGVPLRNLLADLQAEILHVTGDAPGLAPITSRPVDAAHAEQFSGIMRDLYGGADLRDLEERFDTLMERAHGAEFAAAIRELSVHESGVTGIAELYERHASMLGAGDGAEVVAPAGHPLHTCQAELRALELAATTLSTTLCRLGPRPSPRTWESLESTFAGALNRVCEVERHLRRIENLVVPLIGGRQGEGVARLLETPSARLRALIEQARVASRAGRRRVVLGLCDSLLEALAEVLYQERYILLPLAMEKVPTAEWRVVRAAEAQYGWAIIADPPPWPRPGGSLRDSPHENDDGDEMARLMLETGTLTAEQVSLMLINLPFDLTFADEQGAVRFFSGGRRIVARRPTIIGRSLLEAGGPLERRTLDGVIAALRAGDRHEAEFWFTQGDRFVHVLFRAVRDAGGAYRGILEVCRDAGVLRTLGTRGLFDTPRRGARVRGTTPITDGIRLADGEIALDCGALTLAQLNLMLAAVPADFSLGDEHDALVHFSSGGIYEDCDRGLIGDTLQECHPAGAQAALQRILEEFRAGGCDAFEAVEHDGESWSYLRYTPLRTAEGDYRGILECNQDITRLRQLQGERREVDW